MSGNIESVKITTFKSGKTGLQVSTEKGGFSITVHIDDPPPSGQYNFTEEEKLKLTELAESSVRDLHSFMAKVNERIKHGL